MTRFEITVHGNHKTWGFEFDMPYMYLDDWLDDGLDVTEILETHSAENEEDGRCLWDYKNLMEETEPYCFRSGECEEVTTGVIIPPAWWASELAKDDVEIFECMN